MALIARLVTSCFLLTTLFVCSSDQKPNKSAEKKKVEVFVDMKIADFTEGLAKHFNANSTRIRVIYKEQDIAHSTKTFGELGITNMQELSVVLPR